MTNNQKENNLVLIKEIGYFYTTPLSKQKYKYGLFKCSCGKEVKANISEVKRGKKRSCGCLIGKPNITHNLSKHRLYPTWQQMMQRTTNKNHIHYKDYGGRGIKVCERWHSVANFIEDMYPSYQEGLSIDRINNDLGYSKDNCRWATKTIQTRNTRLLVEKNKTGYRGVNFHQNGYVSRISVNNIRIYLGRFETAIEAAMAFDKYAIDNNLEHTRNF